MTHDKIMTDRKSDLDIAKGIGIILVVWAHVSGPFSSYINAFHMPLFFFISGMLYQNKNISCKEYTLHKAYSLLFPFWGWNFLLYPVFFVLYYWKNWSFKTLSIDLIEILSTLDKVPFLGATWFLPALFWVSVTVNFFVKKLNRFRFCDIALLGFGGGVCWLGFEITFPYRISRTLICLLFYVLGYLYQKYLNYRIWNPFNKNIIACLAGSVFAAVATVNSINMGENIYEYKLLFVIGALLAIFFTLRFSFWLSCTVYFHVLINHLIYLGRNTLDIVIWQFLAFRIAIVFQILILGINIRELTAFPIYDGSGLWWVLYLITGIYGSLMWKYVLENNFLSVFMKKIHLIRA